MKKIHLYSAFTLLSLTLFLAHASENIKETGQDDFQKSAVLTKEKTDEDLKKSLEKGILDLSFEGLQDEDMFKSFINFVSLNSFTTKWDNKQVKCRALNFEGNSIKDSGAISLACLVDYLEDLEEINLLQNPVETVGIQAIFIKALGSENDFTFKFTASEEIKNLLCALATRHQKPVTWVEQTRKSENKYNFEVFIGNKDCSSFNPVQDH